MRLFYTLLHILLLPIILLRLFWKGTQFPNYRKRWKERFGYSIPKLNSSIWVHAVSLGEVIAAIPLIKELKKHYPHLNLVVTTTTATGSQKVSQTFTSNEIFHSYVPYDIPIIIKRFLNQINPLLVIIIETELWPNILHFCNQRHIPILLANARLSANSFRGYKKIRWFTSSMLNNINLVAAQSELDAKRYLALGAKTECVETIGNIKFDITIPPEIITKASQLRAKLGKDRIIWIAASTHEGEEEEVLLALDKIKTNIPNTLLILVPRHPERFQKVIELCYQYGFKTISYSKDLSKITEPTIDNNICILVGDIVGELLLFYAASDIVFVGGSLVDIGGHNLLEPAALSLPIITGKFLSNFQEISQILTAANALTYVTNHQELATAIINLSIDQQLRITQGKYALEVIKHNKGALNKLIQWVGSHLSQNIV